MDVTGASIAAAIAFQTELRKNYLRHLAVVRSALCFTRSSEFVMLGFISPQSSSQSRRGRYGVRV
jgi:hypothetical protein